jgi:hypothetical protein
LDIEDIEILGKFLVEARLMSLFKAARDVRKSLTCVVFVIHHASQRLADIARRIKDAGELACTKIFKEPTLSIALIIQFFYFRGKYNRTVEM